MTSWGPIKSHALGAAFYRAVSNDLGGRRGRRDTSLFNSPQQLVAPELDLQVPDIALMLNPEAQLLPAAVLFRDHPTGDTIAGVARRIGLHIVGLSVNHQCSATVAED